MFNIMKNYAKFMAVSAIIILAGIVTLIINGGFATDIDFAGGTMMQVNIGQEFETADVEAIITEKTGKKVDTIQKASDETAEHQVMFKMATLDVEERTAVFEGLKEKYGLADETAIMASDNITPLVSSEIIYNALLSVAIAVVLILIYITIRFTFASGVAAVVALLHDTLIMLSVYSIFRIAVNASFVAAILTIIGYSINATIVIFDRVRENKKFAKKGENFADTCEKSIWQTMRRTINTTATTLISLIILAVLGSASIRGFVIPLIVGIIAGTYSSVFISSPVWCLIEGGYKKNAK